MHREKFGKAVKTLRNEGLVPAELYGHGSENLHLSVPIKDFTKIFKEAGTSTVVTLTIDKTKTPALIHKIQYDFLSGAVAHIDFYQVRMDEVIVAKVPVEFVGESKAEKEFQAMITKSLDELEVEALPGDLPHSFTVDISALDELNKSIYVKDIALPKGVKMLVDLEMVIATATPPRVEEEVVVAPVDLSAIKTEGEEKKAERDAGKEEKE